MAKITTVIDIGSNSARMAIFEKTSRYGFRLIHELKAKVRISEGSYGEKSYLQEAAMQRALEALVEFKRVSILFKSRKMLCVATSALRDAPNKAVFINRVRKECGINIKVIEGTREAYFGALACANLMHKKSGVTVDIGGGSTELACIDEGVIKQSASLNLGSIRLKELYFDAGKVEEAYDFARRYVKEKLAGIIEAYRVAGERPCLLGIGGSIRAYARYARAKRAYPLNVIHGYELDCAEVLADLKVLVAANHKELLSLGIESSRLDSIRPGLLILQVIMEAMRASSLVISGVGLREGVFLHDMLRNHGGLLPKGFNPSLTALRDVFLTTVDDSKRIGQHVNKLFELFSSLDSIALAPWHLQALRVASKLYSVGHNVSFYQAHKHSGYLALHCLNYGFSHQERCLISTLLESSHKKRPRPVTDGLDALLPSYEVMQILSYIFAISVGLAKECKPGFRLDFDSSAAILHIDGISLPSKQMLKEIKPPNLKLNIAARF